MRSFLGGLEGFLIGITAIIVVNAVLVGAIVAIAYAISLAGTGGGNDGGPACFNGGGSYSSCD
jgi:hypothetical protein